MYTKFGADSSNPFPFTARTNKQTDRHTDATERPTHDGGYTAGVVIRKPLNGVAWITSATFPPTMAMKVGCWTYFPAVTYLQFLIELSLHSTCSRPSSRCWVLVFLLWPWILTNDLDLRTSAIDSLKTNQHAKYLSKRQFSSQVIVRTHTDTYAHICTNAVMTLLNATKTVGTRKRWQSYRHTDPRRQRPQVTHNRVTGCRL